MPRLARRFQAGGYSSGGAAGMEIARVALRQHGKKWSVEVMLKEGGVRRYHYGSEAQARYFAAVFALGPRWLPPTSRGRRGRGSRVVAPSAGRAAGGPA